MKNVAHTVKGAVSHFGADEAYSAAHQLELMGKSGNMQDAAAACEALDRALAGLLAALRPICGETSQPGTP
jgi:hypothetical protein